MKFCFLMIASYLLLVISPEANAKPLYKAVAFDIITLFDANSITPLVEKEFPGKGKDVLKFWRMKQLEYGLVRSAAGKFTAYEKMIEDSLDFTLNALNLKAGEESRARLLKIYHQMVLYPDVIPSLKRLKESGVKIMTIANFSEEMLRANTSNAGISIYFDNLLSTEKNKTLKPDPAAYGLGPKVMNLKKEEILYVAFGAWDVFGSRNFGFPTYWLNRSHLPEELGTKADFTSDNLPQLVDHVLGVKI